MKKLSHLETAIRFISYDIWRIQVEKLSTANAFGIKSLRILLTAIRRFTADNCYLKASALTFYSLLSIVPVLAALFGIAKGFGLKEALEATLIKQFSEQAEVLEQAIAFAHALLDQTQGGVIAGVGVLFLLWTVIKLLSNIEHSLNDIWRIHQPRSFSRKFSDYIAILIVCPIFITASGSLNVALATQVSALAAQHEWLQGASYYLLALARYTPYLLLWFVFTFLYLFVPNAKVNLAAGVLGGVVAGTLYQITQYIYITFQIGVASYGAVYGSFAALPLFLIWLQTSWMIVLIGGEIAAASQNLEDYEFRHTCSNISHHFRRTLALLVAQRVVSDFVEERPAPEALQISRELEIPIRLVRDLLESLIQAGVLSQVQNPETDEYSYLPARNIHSLTIQSVSQALDHLGTDELPVANSKEYKKLKKLIAKKQESLDKSPENLELYKI